MLFTSSNTGFKTLCLSLLISASAAMNVSAQEIREIKSDVNGYISLLKQQGYALYSFDISSLAPTKYQMIFSIMEYRDGEPVEAVFNGHPVGKIGMYNLRKVSDFKEYADKNSPHYDNSIINNAVDPEHDIYSKSDKLNIGFLPTENDSVKSVSIELDGMGTGIQRVQLLPIKNPNIDHNVYSYDTRPFKVPEKIVPGKFTPLAAIISFWYDDKFGIMRCCGETKLSPDVENSGILKQTPHFYVIGVTIEEKAE